MGSARSGHHVLFTSFHIFSPVNLSPVQASALPLHEEYRIRLQEAANLICTEERNSALPPFGHPSVFRHATKHLVELTTVILGNPSPQQKQFLLVPIWKPSDLLRVGPFFLAGSSPPKGISARVLFWCFP